MRMKKSTVPLSSFKSTIPLFLLCTVTVVTLIMVTMSNFVAAAAAAGATTTRIDLASLGQDWAKSWSSEQYEPFRDRMSDGGSVLQEEQPSDTPPNVWRNLAMVDPVTNYTIMVMRQTQSFVVHQKRIELDRLKSNHTLGDIVVVSMNETKQYMWATNNCSASGDAQLWDSYATALTMDPSRSFIYLVGYRVSLPNVMAQRSSIPFVCVLNAHDGQFLKTIDLPTKSQGVIHDAIYYEPYLYLGGSLGGNLSLVTVNMTNYNNPVMDEVVSLKPGFVSALHLDTMSHTLYVTGVSYRAFTPPSGGSVTPVGLDNTINLLCGKYSLTSKSWDWIRNISHSNDRKSRLVSTGLVLDSASERVIVVGYFSNEVNVNDTIYTSSGLDDYFVIQLASVTGSVQLVLTAGDSLNDRALGVQLGKAGSLFVYGNYDQPDAMSRGTYSFIMEYKSDWTRFKSKLGSPEGFTDLNQILMQPSLESMIIVGRTNTTPLVNDQYSFIINSGGPFFTEVEDIYSYEDNDPVSFVVDNNRVVEPCTDMVASAVITGGDILNYTFSWSVSPFPPIYSQIINDILVNQTSSTITIPYSAIASGYFFYLRMDAKNRVSGKVDTEHSYFTKHSLFAAGYNIQLDEGENFFVFNRERTTFYATIDLPSCFDTITKKWRFYDVDIVTNDSRVMFEIPVLTPARYDFGIYLQVGDEGVPITRSLAINVMPDKPIAIIKGGNRIVHVGTSLLLDATASFDVARQDATPSYTWYCSNCQVTSSSGAKYQFEAISTGTYKISMLFISDQTLSTRNATRIITITVINDDVPTLSLDTIVDDILNTQSRLSIAASLLSTSDKKVSYWWVVEQSGIDAFSTKVTTILTPLSIEKNSIAMNSTVTIRVRGTYSQDGKGPYGEASVTVRTTLPPVITETLSSSTVFGTSLVTQFDFEIEATDIDEGYPLTFTYSYLDPITQRLVPIRYASRFNQLSTILPMVFGSQGRVQIVCTVTNALGYSTQSDPLEISLTGQLTIDDSLTRLLVIRNLLFSTVDISSRIETLFNTLSAMIFTVSKATLNERQQTVLSQMMDKLVQTLYDDFQRSGSSSTFDKFVAKASTLELLTRSRSIISYESVEKARSMLLVLLDPVMKNQTASVTNDDDSQLIAYTVSNLYLIGQQNQTQSEIDLALIDKLRDAIVKYKTIAESVSDIITESFRLVLKVDYGANIVEQSLETDSVKVNLPSSLKQLEDGIAYGMELLSFSNTTLPYMLSSSAHNISSSVATFKILFNNTKVPLKDLSAPISIILKKQVELDNPMLYSYQCRYLDEFSNNTWGTSGCWLHDVTDDEIICRCSHTTSFASFIIFDDKTVRNSVGISATYIAFHILFIAACSTLIVLLIVLRNKQPIRSRAVVPYIGLTAIILESILQGIIRNSLLIGGKSNKSVNVTAYFILSIVDPITLLSLVLFFWQQLRFFFCKNVYSVMERTNMKNLKMRVLRLLISRLAIIIIALVFITTLLCYYVLLSILEGTNVIVAQLATAFNALSSASMTLAIGLLIVAALLYDFVVNGALLFWNIGKKDNLLMEEESNSGRMKIVSAFFVGDDPLYFRIEGVLMCAAMFAMFVSYSLGIAAYYDQHSSPNSGVRVVSLLFDLLYISIRIMAFGGFIVTVALIRAIRDKLYGSGYDTLVDEKDNSSVVSESESTVSELLYHEYGGKLLTAYAKAEFSLENLLIYKKLNHLRGENERLSGEQRYAKLQELWDNYLLRGSPYEVNVSASCKKKVTAITKGQTSLTEEQMRQAIRLISGEVVANICDTFTRFSKTSEYERYKKLKSTEIQLQSVVTRPQ